MDMNPANDPVIHSYDVEHHAVRCGAPGHPTSTKHARGVTCPECLRLLAAAAATPEPTSSHS